MIRKPLQETISPGSPQDLRIRKCARSQQGLHTASQQASKPAAAAACSSRSLRGPGMKILCLFRFPWKDLEEIWVKSFPRGPRIEILDIFSISSIYKWVVTIIANQ